MAKMAATVGAQGLGAQHPMGSVPDVFDGPLHGLVEGWPSAATFKLVPAFKEQGIAGPTVVVSPLKMQIVFAGMRPFRAFLAQYMVFLGAQLPLPFPFGFANVIFFVHFLKSSVYCCFASGTNSRAAPLTQCLRPVVSRGPSSKTWPRCPPQLAQCSSDRATPILHSTPKATWPSISRSKLGQPVPESNLCSLRNRGCPQPPQT